MEKRKLYAITLILSVFLSASLVIFGETASASTPLSSVDLLHRQGNQLVNANGTPVVLKGTTGNFVDNGQGAWMTTSGYTSSISAMPKQLDLMQAWGFNSIRLTMSVELWLKDIDNNRANLRSVVTEAQQRGIYVTVAPWSVLYSGNPSGEWQSNALPYPPYQGDQSSQTLTATQEVIPNKQAFINFYGQLVNDLKGYPNVLFEVWNEPHADVYAGESARSDFFANVVNPIITNARNSGAQQPFVLDSNWGGIYMGNYLTYAANVPDSNIVLSFHIYNYFGHLSAWGSPTDYNGLMNAFTASGVLAASKSYPIDLAEIGITKGSASERVQYDNILRICSEQGWGWGAWWFRDTNIFAFVDSRANPTAEGLIYQKWLTPSPTPTPTSTPQPTPTPTPAPIPTITPTPTPTIQPTPTITPTPTTTPDPTLAPDPQVTQTPTENPTPQPTITTTKPTPRPTSTHTQNPTAKPTSNPTATPNSTPTTQPTITAPPTENQNINQTDAPNSTWLYVASLVASTLIAIVVLLNLFTSKRSIKTKIKSLF